MTTLYIKNMVCNRCLLAVQNIFDQMQILPHEMRLGEVVLPALPADAQIQILEEKLQSMGFELIDDKKGRLIEKIKNLIIEVVHHSSDKLKVNLSDYLADQLPYDYAYLSHIFSEVEGTTIEKYHIAQKIERVKELLVYNELSLSEISYQLGYSSVAHLSSQFKKVTGLTPSHFKDVGARKRKPLDKV